MIVIIIPATYDFFYKLYIAKPGRITDPDRLFNDLAVHVCDKYKEIGLELGLPSEVLTNELETGVLKLERGNRKAIKMFELWRQSVTKDDFTYYVLAAALKKHGFQRCAHEFCYANIGNPII